MNHQPQNIANEPMDAQLQTNVSVGPSGSNGRSASLIPSRMPLKKRTCQELPMTCNGYVSYNPRDSFSGGYSGDRTGNVSGLDNGYDGGDSDSFTGDETTDSHRKSKAKFKMKKPSRVIISIAKKKRKYSGNASISPITSSLSSFDENENCKPPKSVRPGEERVQRKVKFVSFLTYQDEEDVASPNLKHDNQDARSSKDMKKNSGDSMISSLTSNDYGPSKSSLCLGKDAGVTQSVTAKHPREDESVNTNNAPRVNPADESSYGMKIRPAPWYCYVDHSQTKNKPFSPLVTPCIAPSFPIKLHCILLQSTFENIVKWLPHGRSWRVVDAIEFEEKILPLYFGAMKMSSFWRQANGWGFKRMTKGRNKNSYYHELFLKGLPHLCKDMKTQRTPSSSTSPKSTQNSTTSRASQALIEPDLFQISQEAPLLPQDTAISDLTFLGNVNSLILRNGPKAKMPLDLFQTASAEASPLSFENRLLTPTQEPQASKKPRLVSQTEMSSSSVSLSECASLFSVKSLPDNHQNSTFPLMTAPSQNNNDLNASQHIISQLLGQYMKDSHYKNSLPPSNMAQGSGMNQSSSQGAFLNATLAGPSLVWYAEQQKRMQQQLQSNCNSTFPTMGHCAPPRHYVPQDENISSILQETQQRANMIIESLVQTYKEKENRSKAQNIPMNPSFAIGCQQNHALQAEAGMKDMIMLAMKAGAKLGVDGYYKNKIGRNNATSENRML